MKGINLIPQPLRLARSRKRRMRKWMLGSAAYAAALLMVCAVIHGLWSSQVRAQSGDIAKTSHRIEDENRTIAGLKAQLAAMQEASRTSTAIADQPDWSILLSALSASTEDELVFREVRLGAASTGGMSRTVADEPWTPRRYQLSLRGTARAASGVSKFVNKLEQMQFFNDVKLLRTTRESFNNAPATGFEMECSFGQQRRAK